MTEQLIIESNAFVAAYGQNPIGVGHRLSEHPLLTLEALADLADMLPADRIEHNMGKVPSVVVGSVSTLDLPPGEIARGIETNGCWMVMKNIERSPAYRDFLHSILDEVVSLIEGHEGSMQDREGFVFLSAPGSVTPSHVDPEHNFLLQIRGTKDFHVGRFPDAETEQRDLERFYGGGGRNIDHLPAEIQTFSLAAGDGVYVPPHAPHWVQNGESVSVSLSVTWRTPVTDRVARAHGINARLRRLHLSPRAPSGDSVRDRTKAMISRSLARIRRLAK